MVVGDYHTVLAVYPSPYRPIAPSTKQTDDIHATKNIEISNKLTRVELRDSQLMFNLHGEVYQGK